MIFAIFQNERVYEGNLNFLHAIYPMPAVSKVSLVAAGKLDLYDFGPVNSMMPPIFREDSFDPTTSVRRGRFYVPNNPSRHDWQAARVSDYPYGQPVAEGPRFYSCDAYTSFQGHPRHDPKKSLIFLGDLGHETAWRVVGTERLYNHELLITLKAIDTLGTLPDLNVAAMPPTDVPTFSRAWTRSQMRLTNICRFQSSTSVEKARALFWLAGLRLAATAKHEATSPTSSNNSRPAMNAWEPQRVFLPAFTRAANPQSRINKRIGVWIFERFCQPMRIWQSLYSRSCSAKQVGLFSANDRPSRPARQTLPDTSITITANRLRISSVKSERSMLSISAAVFGRSIPFGGAGICVGRLSPNQKTT
jgi:hypothetical protein